MPLSLAYAKRCDLAGPQYIWGPSRPERRKIHLTVLSIDMMFMECGALADDVASGAHNHGLKTSQTAFAHLEMKQQGPAQQHDLFSMTGLKLLKLETSRTATLETRFFTNN